MERTAAHDRSKILTDPAVFDFRIHVVEEAIESVTVEVGKVTVGTTM